MDSTSLMRRNGEALAPELADKQQLHRQMLKIGAHRFKAEYQQDPFEHFREDDMRYSCFGSREDEPDSSAIWFGRIPESKIMAYEVFGIGSCHPAPLPQHFTIEDGPLPVEDVESNDLA